MGLHADSPQLTFRLQVPQQLLALKSQSSCGTLRRHRSICGLLPDVFPALVESLRWRNTPSAIASRKSHFLPPQFVSDSGLRDIKDLLPVDKV